MGKSDGYFDGVDQKVDFPKMERELLDSWRKKGIVKKYLAKNASANKCFSFLDGPITANNPMGVHHAWGRTYKDLWQRYKNMHGFKQRFQNGFDCQGLWVEVEVEKELGVKSKKDIENLVPGDKKKSIEKFVNLCKERVVHYSKVQTEQSKRLGYFMDWENSYYTMSEANNYLIWHFLKTCHDNGWLYNGNESVPWCPRCQTAISQHEMLTEDYKEVTHKSIIMKFPVISREKEYLLVWTTTPWTIPANIAVAVDENLDYALVENGTRRYWLAEGAINRVITGEKKVVKRVKGAKLVGLKYEAAFDDLPAVKRVKKEFPDKLHSVIATDDRIMPISVDEGTGLVHTAVSAGTEDFRLGQKLGLPMIPVIADDASYLEDLGFLTGKNAKTHPEIILDYLSSKEKKEGDWVYSIFDYAHRYPACWRCKTELVWKVTKEWYIAMDRVSKTSDKSQPDAKTLRQRMKAVAKKINWIPDFGLKRELDWLDNMHDWLISKKNRYWGLALPIWECSLCGHFAVIGSKEELKEKTVEGWEEFEAKSPHKPQIDVLKVRCERCGKLMERIEPVGNPWLDAGIVAYSTISRHNKATKIEPTSEKPLYYEDKKEWLNWFPADFITESFPGQFKNWFYALIAMSTVLEDEPPTKTILGFATLLAEDGRPMHKSWGNAIEFNEGAEKIGVDVMRFMYASQNPAENLLFGYKVADEVRRAFHLKLWNVYNYFTTYANTDNWQPPQRFQVPKSENSLDLWVLSRLANTTKQVSQSLDEYDVYAAAQALQMFLDDLSNWYIRRSRGRTGVASQSEKDKNNFYETCYFVLVTFVKMLAPINPFIAETIYKNLTKEESVHLAAWPSEKGVKAIAELESQMAAIRLITEKIHAARKEDGIPVRQPLAQVDIVDQNLKVTSDLTEILLSEVNIKKAVWKKGKSLAVKIDTTITKELEEEALTRELMRKIQNERKKLGVELDEKVDVKSEWLPTGKLLDELKRVTQAKTVSEGKFEVTRI